MESNRTKLIFLEFLIVCIGWRETNCVTGVRTPSQDLPCNAVIPGNANGANSGYCECTFGQTNVVTGCGTAATPFQFQTCNAACGFATMTTTVMEDVIRTVDDAMDENMCKSVILLALKVGVSYKLKSTILFDSNIALYP